MKNCVICQGIGFHKGEICVCITVKESNPFEHFDDFLSSMFGKDIPDILKKEKDK